MPRRLHRARSSLGSSSRSEEHTSELQSHFNLVCRLLLGKKNMSIRLNIIITSALEHRPPLTARGLILNATPRMIRSITTPDLLTEHSMLARNDQITQSH